MSRRQPKHRAARRQYHRGGHAACHPCRHPARRPTTARPLWRPPRWARPPKDRERKPPKPPRRRPESPSAPASSWGAETGSFGSRFCLSWPRGAFRSSAKAKDPRESLRESSMRRFCQSAVALSTWSYQPKSSGAAFQPPRKSRKRDCDQFGTGDFELGGNAELTWVPRRSSSAILRALSFLASGGI